MGPKTQEIMQQTTRRFAVHVARHPFINKVREYTYLTGTSAAERARRDQGRIDVALESDRREWALVESLAERYGVDLSTVERTNVLVAE